MLPSQSQPTTAFPKVKATPEEIIATLELMGFLEFDKYKAC